MVGYSSATSRGTTYRFLFFFFYGYFPESRVFRLRVRNFRKLNCLTESRKIKCVLKGIKETTSSTDTAFVMAAG